MVPINKGPQVPSGFFKFMYALKALAIMELSLFTHTYFIIIKNAYFGFFWT